MVWSRLFKMNDIPTALKPIQKNGFWRKPDLSGRDLGKLKSFFRKFDIPFIFQEKYVTPHGVKNSSYDIFPKGLLKKESNQLKRYSKVRMALYRSKERELKARQDLVNKRKVGGIHHMLRCLYPFMIKASKANVHRIGGGGGQSSRKVIPDSIKGVPKAKGLVRKQKEIIKNYMDDNLITQKDLQAFSGKKQSSAADKKQQQNKEQGPSTPKVEVKTDTKPEVKAPEDNKNKKDTKQAETTTTTNSSK